MKVLNKIKRAQVTIWIIIAIFLIIGFYILHSHKMLQDSRSFSINSDGLQAKLAAQGVLESCLQQALAQNLEVLSLQGGYIYPSEAISFESGIRIPYLLTASRDSFPDLATSQKELQDALNVDVTYCLDNYHSIAEMGYSIVSRPALVMVRFNAADVTASANDETVFKRESTSFSLMSSSSQVDVPYTRVYDFMKRVHSIHEKKLGSLPLSSVAEESYRSNVTFTMSPTGETGILYEFEFPFSFHGKPFRSNYLVELVKHEI